MVGQRERGDDGRYVVGDGDNADVGNGDDVGIASITDIDFGSITILSGDVQFHEYGRIGDLWSEPDYGEWSGNDDRPAGTGDRRVVAADTGTYFDRGNTDTNQYADEHTDEYTD